MMENGAGELEPGQRLRQLARKIRSGEAPLGTAKFYPTATMAAEPVAPAPFDSMQQAYDQGFTHGQHDTQIRAAEPVEGAEPMAWLAESGEATKFETIANGWKRNGGKVTPLYTHPAPASAQAGAVPDGYVLAPLEPSAEMLYQMQDVHHLMPPRGRRVWKTLLKVIADEAKAQAGAPGSNTK
jgi:hypothetical protein